jgi:DNA-binding transcriptional LysR family regulator
MRLCICAGRQATRTDRAVLFDASQQRSVTLLWGLKMRARRIKVVSNPIGTPMAMPSNRQPPIQNFLLELIISRCYESGVGTPNDELNLGHIRRSNLNLLYALDAILNARSLTEAGQRILLSQPAMSVSLRKLRAQFNDQLVLYINGERTLTPLAIALRPKVRHLLGAVDETFRFQLAFNAKTATRSFRIAAPEAIEMMLLTRAVPNMLNEAPLVDVQIVPVNEADPASAFENGADLLVIPASLADTRFRQRSLMTDSMSCMVWNHHPWAGESLSKREYMDARHVVVARLRGAQNHLNAQVRHLLAERRIGAQTRRHAALAGLVIGTDLVATGSIWLFQHFASIMPVRIVSPPFETPPEPIIIQWPQHLDEEPSHCWLVDHLVTATHPFRIADSEEA